MNKISLLTTIAVVVFFLGYSSVEGQQQQLPSITPAAPLIGAQVAKANCTLLTSKPTASITKFALQTCIVAQLSGYLTLDQGKYINLVNGTVNTNSSKCDNVTTHQKPMLVIDFDCASLSLSVNHSNNSETFVDVITVSYMVNGTLATVVNTTPQFNTTQTGHYYKCNSEQTIPLSGSNLNTSLVVSNVALETYRNGHGTDFYQLAEDCPLDSQPVSDLVRIGVGVCLIALVAIVLIAYFIGRRRWSERSSYESV